MRNIAIVGAGQAGCQLGVGLVDAGYDVTLFTDRSARDIGEGAVSSAQCMFATALEAEKRLGLNFWENDAPNVDRIVMRIQGRNELSETSFDGRFDIPGKSVDQRVKLPKWMDVFESKGGKIRVASISAKDLESLAHDYDLVVVASGAGELSQVFPSVTEFSSDHPRRNYALTYLNTATVGDSLHIEIIPGVGEINIVPGLSTNGVCTIVLFASVPGGPMDEWSDVNTSEEHVKRTREMIQNFIPEMAEELCSAPLTDPHGRYIGKVTAVVRQPVATLQSGATVLGIADAILLSDPTAGQGANTAAKAAAFYLERILAHEGAVFDAEWMRRVGDDFWRAWSRWVAAWTRSMAEGVPNHVKNIFANGSIYHELGHDIAAAMDDPARFHPWWYEAEEAEALVERYRNGSEINLDRRELRRTFGQFATGVTVITTRTPNGHMVGVTANSFTSVSLAPPLVLWCLDNNAASRRHFMAATHFAVNVLRSDQHHLSRRFAVKGEDKFVGVPIEDGPGGLPLLREAIAHLQCRRVQAIEAGDHIILLGEVERFSTTDGEPLVFHSGSYRVATKHPDLEQLG
jgi:flavin reductase (DIM6/NTAB) family NADH-FMN oxidoreductase RutF/2-polyprenyl-6-methoxyphenol hydroxylase-like FAD-dependent oxidoreductase